MSTDTACVPPDLFSEFTGCEVEQSDTSSFSMLSKATVGFAFELPTYILGDEKAGSVDTALQFAKIFAARSLDAKSAGLFSDLRYLESS